MTPFDALVAAGLRTSVFRLRVLEVFAREPARYFAVEQIAAELVAHQARQVSLSTLYRQVNALHRGGVLLACRLVSGTTVFRWLDGAPPAMRLVCRRCGRIEETDDPALHRCLTRLMAGIGWRRSLLPLDCHGVCARCRPLLQGGRRRTAKVPVPDGENSCR